MIHKTIDWVQKTALILIVAALTFSACAQRTDTPTLSPTTVPSATAPAADPTTPALPSPTPTLAPTSTPQGLIPPIRAAFYYAYNAEDWPVDAEVPRSRFTPNAGFYATSDPGIFTQHIRQMQYAGVQAAILTGAQTSSSQISRLAALMDASPAEGFFWSAELQPGREDPSPDPAGILDSLYSSLASRPNFLKIAGKPVIFLLLVGELCPLVETWTAANQGRFYLALSAGEGYPQCAAQPDGWYPQLQPGVGAAATASAAVIRPGYWPAEAALGQFRSLPAWEANIRQVFDPALTFHLVDSFNNWSEGTAVEPAREWLSDSGMGAYLDMLSPGFSAENGEEPVYIAGAGDISVCDWPFDDRVSDLFAIVPGEIFTLGDNSNEEGAYEQYQRCFDDSWGRFKERIHPVPGNHDFVNPGARAYFEYFGDLAGEPGKGYYSYDLGSWHLITLNGNCSAVGGCWAGSPQETWLREDLAAHPTACTLAYWHQPRWSSGIHGGDDTYDAFWRALYDYGVELVMNGHDHHYERFAPQNPDGVLDQQNGIRQFISGTGGAGTRRTGEPQSNSEVLHTGSDGLLALSLYPDRYEWQFIPVGADAFSDWGTTDCH